MSATSSSPNRRTFLASSAAVGASGLFAAKARAATEKADPVSASEWDYSTIKELSAALVSRRISASELLDHTIARIEALDNRLNAVVVRDFERLAKQLVRPMQRLAKGSDEPCLGSRSHLKNRSMLWACRRHGASRSSRVLYRKRTRSSYRA